MVLNAHAPTEDRTDDFKDRFYDVQCVFDKFTIYHMKILLGDFNAKVGTKDTFKPTSGNESRHEIRNANGVTVVSFPTFKNLSKVHCSHIIPFINLLGHLRMKRLTIKFNIFS
jgi:hypothetical protein